MELSSQQKQQYDALVEYAQKEKALVSETEKALYWSGYQSGLEDEFNDFVHGVGPDAVDESEGMDDGAYLLDEAESGQEDGRADAGSVLWAK